MKNLQRLLLALGLLALPQPVIRAQTPINGFSYSLPATIECELFDLGNAGIAYSDTTANNAGGKLRYSDVDIFRADAMSGSRGYVVGNTQPGEWMLYSIRVTEAGTYTFEVRARTALSAVGNSTFHLELDGVNVSGSLTLYNYTWQTVSCQVALSSGPHLLKLVIDSGYYQDCGYFDYIHAYRTPATPTFGSASTSVVLTPGQSSTAADANRVAIRNAILGLPTGGGTIVLPAGEFWIRQPNSYEYGQGNNMYSSWDNIAVLVDRSNVKILGSGSGSGRTKLRAWNRVTTIFYVGDWNPYSLSNVGVTDVQFHNITFVGNPTISAAGTYDATGLMNRINASSNNMNNLGALIMVSGDSSINSPGQYTFARRFRVTSCQFDSAPTSAIYLAHVKDGYFSGNVFNYFVGISPALADTLQAWVAINAPSYRTEDLFVANNVFNGNVNMAARCDYAADGLVWFGNGGRYFVRGNTIANYRFEAIHLNAGPYSVTENTFTTFSDCSSAVALMTFHNANVHATASPASLESNYCFVNNTVSGGWSGVGGTVPVTNGTPGAPPFGSYNLMVTANRIELTANPLCHGGTTLAIGAEYGNYITVVGNVVARANTGVAMGHYRTDLPLPEPTSRFWIACNDFSGVSYRNFYVQNPSYRPVKATIFANKMASGAGGGHIVIEGWTTNKADLTVRGNRFLPVPPNSPVFSPVPPSSLYIINTPSSVYNEPSDFLYY